VADIVSDRAITGSGRASSPDALAAVRADHGCFGCGAENPIGLRLRFAAGESGVTARFTPAPEHQGFEGVVHGGIISTVLDEAMAWATAAAGIWAVTAEMQVRFRQPLHVGERTRVEASVTTRKGRVIKVAAEVVLEADNVRIATATGTFFEVAAEVADTWRARYLVPDPAAQRETAADPESG
jgi:uncharacterized protein (TIGR00369 family)